MRRTIILLTGVILVMCASLVQAGDKEDIGALINEYCRLEGLGDLMGQAKLMTPDRIMIGVGIRNTNQAANMKVQQAFRDRNKQLDPGSKLLVTPIDPIIRVYGNTAVASFYQYLAWVWSAEFLKQQNLDVPPGTPPGIVTLVLVKQGRTWKIAHTHYSPLYPPSSN